LKEINIEQFKSMNELYSFIDENEFEIRTNWDLRDIWIRYKNLTKNEIEKEKSQWEIDYFSFNIQSDILFSQIYSETKNSKEINKYPDLNKFQKESIDYLIQRIETTKSTILLARYNHLLWKCPTGIKKTKYAINAIDNYIISVKEFYKLFKKKNDNEIPFQIANLFEVLLAISNEIKSERLKLKELTQFLLFKAENIDFYIREGILKDMLEYPKIFKSKDFRNSLTLFDKFLQKPNLIDNFMLANEQLSTAIKIANKTSSDNKKWHNEKGLAYLRLANEINNEDRFWVKQDYHSKAITEFKLASHIENRKKTELLYAQLKPQIKLPTISIPYSEEVQLLLRKQNENIQSFTNKLLKQNSIEIYRFLSIGSFFPSYENVKESSKDTNSFLDFVTAISFDKNKNITKEKVNNSELKKIFDTYKIQIETSVLPYLHFTIIKGIKSGCLTIENFIQFLENETWIGKTHIRYDLGGKEQHINWIKHLSPSITEFFLQVQAWGSSKYYTPSFILCIDSFTLKMEGVFRNFCERAGIPTSFDKKKGMQEAYINNVFDNETIIKYFNEDDRLFFNYLFSNDGGLNLRNNVAHCFYNTNEYHPDKMLLLIAVILRLGKYDYKKTKPSS
jgi:hypothetical protein